MQTYSYLLSAISPHLLYRFVDYCTTPTKKAVLLRHDVDKRPLGSLRFAQIQNSLGIRGTYYFRIVPESFHPKTIEVIAGLGHEIGYHYEDVALTAAAMKAKKENVKDPEGFLDKLLEESIESFAVTLAFLRKYADIKTICMHGSPLSPWDSRLLWTRYNYRDFGIIGEPYFAIDFTQVAYYTDTGRRWDGDNVSLRDKVNHGGQNFPKFSSTFDIIRAAESGILPRQVMFTFHPQRWHDRPLPWLAEWASQNVKNEIKRCFFVPAQQCVIETSRSAAK